MRRPVKRAYRMGSKRNDPGTDPEEQEVMINIKLQRMEEAYQIIIYRLA